MIWAVLLAITHVSALSCFQSRRPDIMIPSVTFSSTFQSCVVIESVCVEATNIILSSFVYRPSTPTLRVSSIDPSLQPSPVDQTDQTNATLVKRDARDDFDLCSKPDIANKTAITLHAGIKLSCQAFKDQFQGILKSGNRVNLSVNVTCCPTNGCNTYPTNNSNYSAPSNASNYSGYAIYGDTQVASQGNETVNAVSKAQHLVLDVSHLFVLVAMMLML